MQCSCLDLHGTALTSHSHDMQDGESLDSMGAMGGGGGGGVCTKT